MGLVLLVALAFAVAWQERRRPSERAIVYSVEESVEFIRARLAQGAAASLRTSDVRRILEWSVRHLQDPEVRSERGEPPVAGGVEAATYVQERAMAAGFAYDGDLILEVLAAQADYLRSLGAIGDEIHGSDELGT
jgi:hypothetical protein